MFDECLCPLLGRKVLRKNGGYTDGNEEKKPIPQTNPQMKPYVLINGLDAGCLCGFLLRCSTEIYVTQRLDENDERGGTFVPEMGGHLENIRINHHFIVLCARRAAFERIGPEIAG